MIYIDVEKRFGGIGAHLDSVERNYSPLSLQLALGHQA